MTAGEASEARPDHRIEVARRRREAMRARILAATMKVCSVNPAAVPTIDEIITAAEISRGAFYRYFTSSAEAIEEVGVALTNELADAILTLYDTLTDPLQRACVGTFLVTERAAADREWAQFILRGDLTIHKTRIMAFIERDMRNGRDAGYFTFGNVAWAAEFVMGMDLTAARGMMVRAESEKSAYREETVRFVLRSLGVDAAMIDTVMAWAGDYLAKHVHNARWWEPEAATTPARTRKPTKRRES